jgi:hypothetical protein
MKRFLTWNWGTGIALVYTAFAVSIVLLVVNSFSKKIDLVAPDYYAKELVYQDQINKMNNARSLKEAIAWNVYGNKLELVFPQEFASMEVKGQATLFKPSDVNADKSYDLSQDGSGKQVISTKGLQSGMYKLKLDWAVDNESYYQEGVIVIK